MLLDTNHLLRKTLFPQPTLPPDQPATDARLYKHEIRLRYMQARFNRQDINSRNAFRERHKNDARCVGTASGKSFRWADALESPQPQLIMACASKKSKQKKKIFRGAVFGERHISAKCRHPAPAEKRTRLRAKPRAGLCGLGAGVQGAFGGGFRESRAKSRFPVLAPAGVQMSPGFHVPHTSAARMRRQ